MKTKLTLVLGTVLLLNLMNATAFAYMATEWSMIDTGAEVAQGSLDGVGIAFSGSDIDQGVIDNSFTGFNSSLFTPPIENSDFVGFRGAPATYRYELAFSEAIQNPILHFYSLASTLTFSTSSITRLSGDPDFTVSGDSVSGVLNDSPSGYDANGTIRLDGTFTDISFTAYYFDSAQDGILMQVGVETSPVPIPASIVLFGCGLAGVLGFRFKKD